jgi:hypothetical protein
MDGYAGEFDQPGLWQGVADDCDVRSACQSADPEPVAVWVAKFELAPVRRFAGRSAELGLDRSDVAHHQTDQGVGPGITQVLGQEQPHPAMRDRNERRTAGIEPIFPLLGETQAFIPPDGHVGVSHTQDRDDLHLHAGMISRPAIRGVQPSVAFAAKADHRSGIARTGVEAAIWAETVTGFDDLAFLLLPRLPGVAHRAWSGPRATWTEHRDRLARHGRLWAQDGLTYFRTSAVDWP